MMANLLGVHVQASSLVRRAATVSAALLALPLVAAPAAAASRPTHVVVAATPATVLAGGPVVVTGTATPVRAGSTVLLQREVGRVWTTLAHQKSGAAGTFSFHLKAPKVKSVWLLRVSRAAGAGDKAGISATQHLRVVTSSFTVSAAASLGATPGQVVVTGTAGPHAKGKVALQRRLGNTWIAADTGTLRTNGGFTINTTLPLNTSYELRVVKAFTTTVAQGTSKTLSVTIPPADPLIGTAALPKAVIGRAYTAALAGTLGTTPYTWTATGLPAGITLTAAGVLSGTATVAGSYPVVVTLTDSGGRLAYATYTLTVAQTRVMAWGYNCCGEIGDGTMTGRRTPGPVALLDAVTSISGNGASVLALRVDGTVWAWGDNGFGQLGLPSVIDTPQPVPVTDLSSVVATASGQTANYVLTADGTVLAAGLNDRGQLGDDTENPSRRFSPVHGLGPATAVASAVDTAYALLRDGTVWAWGRNDRDQLGDGATGGFSPHPVQVAGLVGVTAIATTYQGGYALLSDGTVRAWGGGMGGALGNGSVVDSPLPVAVVGLANVRALANNEGVDGYALKTDGTVWAWGPNIEGTIGDGTTTDRTVPTLVPGASGAVALGVFGAAYAVMPDGTMRSWGENSNGALGLGDEVNRTSPTPVPGLSGVVYTAGSEATGFAVVTGP